MTPVTDVPASYPTAETQTVFRSGRVIDVRTDVVEMPDGDRATRDVVVHPGAVGIIALRDDEHVLLVQQYRHAVQHMLWEPPAGLLDKAGEEPLDAAKRELFEEAHLRAGRWDALVDAFTSPGMSSEAVRIYLARDLSDAQEERYAGEHEERDMPVQWVSLDELVAAIHAGTLHNPMAVMGVMAAAAARQSRFTTLRAPDADWPARA